MTQKDEIILSKTITFLRFPLIVAVVFIHMGLGSVMVNGTFLVTEENFPVYGLLHHVITDELARIAVPLFFFISGFLFFYHSDFSMKTYGEKLKRRCRTLLVPYIFWNVAVFMLMLFAQMFLPSLMSGQNKPIADYEWFDWLNIFWGCISGMPVCYQLWFIRELIIVILFAPLLHFYIRHFRAFGVLVLGLLWLFNLWFTVPGFKISAFFFFSFGAWLSINKRNFAADFLPLRWFSAFIYLAIVVLNTYLWHCKAIDNDYLHNAGIVAGLVAAVSWTAHGFTDNSLSTSAFLSKSSFFVYAYHGIPLAFMVKCWLKMCSPLSECSVLACYFTVPVITIAVGLVAYWLLLRCFPSFTALITGGR